MTVTLFVADAIRYTAGLLLACAALGKGFSLAAFRANLHDGFHLPLRAAAALAPVVVLTEATLALAILSGQDSARPALGAAFLLLLLFTLVLAHRFLQEGMIRCACFGEPERAVSSLDLLRNALMLMAIAAWLMLPPAAGAETLRPLSAAMAVLWTMALIGLHDIVSILHGDGWRP
jgi:hypothetical protein